MHETKLWTRLVIAYGIVSALAIWGCTATEVTSSANSEVRDSAGVTIVTTPGEVARAPMPWSVTPEQDLEIGHEGAPEYEFDQIQGLRQLDDGGILAVDAGSAELRFYDPEGQFVAKLGRRGNGPGEFQQPVLVPGRDSDAILIFDARLNRFTFVSVDNQEIEVMSPPIRVTGTPLGFVGGRSLMRSAPLSVGGADGAQPPSRALFTLTDPVTGESDTVAAFDGPQLFRAQIPGESLGLTTGVLFKIFPSGAAGANGPVIHGANAPEIMVADSAARPRRILRIAEPARHVTEEIVAEVAARQGRNAGDASVTALWHHIYDQMPLPEALPAFHRLLVDDQGWVWAEVYRPERDPLLGPLDLSVEALWMVFDQDGAARGSLEMPRDLYVHQIGRDFVLGVGRDALGVETIRRHRINRP